MKTPLDTICMESLNETNLQGGGATLLPNGLPKEGLEKTLCKEQEIQFLDLPVTLYFKGLMI